MKAMNFFLGLALTAIMYSSCVPQLYPERCTSSSCVDVVIAGKVNAYRTQDSLAIPITCEINVRWWVKDYSYDKYNIATFSPKSDGIFCHNTTIDTSFFFNYNLYISLQVNYSVDTTIRNYEVNGSRVFERFNRDTLTNLDFIVYITK
jgi:CRISPR/Cas system CSM-associated protein Csm5 (group 7 of RAMP superfamily)